MSSLQLFRESSRSSNSLHGLMDPVGDGSSRDLFMEEHPGEDERQRLQNLFLETLPDLDERKETLPDLDERKLILLKGFAEAEQTTHERQSKNLAETYERKQRDEAMQRSEQMALEKAKQLQLQARQRDESDQPGLQRRTQSLLDVKTAMSRIISKEPYVPMMQYSPTAADQAASSSGPREIVKVEWAALNMSFKLALSFGESGRDIRQKIHAMLTKKGFKTPEGKDVRLGMIGLVFFEDRQAKWMSDQDQLYGKLLRMDIDDKFEKGRHGVIKEPPPSGNFNTFVREAPVFMAALGA
eukprot:g324.t1